MRGSRPEARLLDQPLVGRGDETPAERLRHVDDQRVRSGAAAVAHHLDAARRSIWSPVAEGGGRRRTRRWTRRRGTRAAQPAGPPRCAPRRRVRRRRRFLRSPRRRAPAATSAIPTTRRRAQRFSRAARGGRERGPTQGFVHFVAHARPKSLGSPRPRIGPRITSSRVRHHRLVRRCGSSGNFAGLSYASRPAPAPLRGREKRAIGRRPGL